MREKCMETLWTGEARLASLPKYYAIELSSACPKAVNQDSTDVVDPDATLG